MRQAILLNFLAGNQKAGEVQSSLKPRPDVSANVLGLSDGFNKYI